MLNPNKVIERKYLTENGERIGFYTGITAFQRIGLSTQMSNVPEIQTNNENSKLRRVKVGSQEVILRKARVKITNQNSSVLQFLEMMNSAAAGYFDEERKEILRNWMQKMNITRQFVTEYAPCTSSYLGVKAEIVEKDYFVTLFLKKLTEIMPEIVFKGGTSLSKCYHVIQRFSEDIDLNLQANKTPSESQRKRMKSAIIQVIEELQFQLMNPEDVRSRREYNRYMIDYPSSVSADYLKEQLIVETAIYQRAYPTRKMKADSLIYQFLTQNGSTTILLIMFSKAAVTEF